MWTVFLLAAAKIQTFEILDCRELNTQFGVMVIGNVDKAESFLCSGFKPDDRFVRDCRGICITNKLANQVNHELYQWRNQEARSLGSCWH
jgi:hypothetical protein